MLREARRSPSPLSRLGPPNNMTETDGPKVTLSFDLSKKRRSREPTADADRRLQQRHLLAQVFETDRVGPDGAARAPRGAPVNEPDAGADVGPPLMIPVAANRFSLAGGTTSAPDLESLPDAPDAARDDEAFARVPVHQFGAAMLRGMGWTGEDRATGPVGDDDGGAVLARPHRLGLGATPRLPDADAPPTHGGAHRRPRRPDQVQRDQAVARQRAEFERDRQERVARDKQRTLQNGSLVHVSLGAPDGPDDDVVADRSQAATGRARIIKLVGVPGLNRVQVQWETQADYAIVQRRQIQGLVSREELEREPFQEAIHPKVEAQQESKIDRDICEQTLLLQPDTVGSGIGAADGKRERLGDSGSQNKPSSDNDRHDKKETKHRDKSKSLRDGPSSKRQKLNAGREPSSTLQWVTVNIRVRIASEKYGRKHFQRKGIVLDVTPKGATVQMDDSGALLDRVPERHLETALPKAGGKAIVLARTSPHFRSKGTLLERNSAKGRGVIQIQDDMAVETLSLDDLAEWCGPLDDDDGFNS